MILKQELLKIAKMRILLWIVIFFIILNVIIVMSKYYLKEDLEVLTELVETYGYEINENMMNELGDDYKKMVVWVNQISPSNELVYKHPSDLLKEYLIQYQSPLSNNEYEQLLKYGVIEGYYRTAQNIDDIYADIDLNKNAESLIKLYGFKGGAAEEVRSQYNTLGERLDELINNGEHKNLFFKGELYEMHSFLFKNIGLVLLFELIILVVLITAAVTNYEFEHRTALVSYSTKRGRMQVVDKLWAALIANACVMTVLIGITLSVVFITYDYSGLFNVPISNYFNTEMALPYISWWDLSFIQYLVLFILFIIISQLLFMGISFILSVFMKNTYIVFFTFIVLLGLGIIIPGYISKSSIWVFILHFNPFVFILNPHEWLMGNGPFTLHPYYEVITIGCWTLLLGILIVVSIYNFKRQQLK